jgi:hypothetical protein
VSHPAEDVWVAILTGTAEADESRDALGHAATCRDCSELRKRLAGEQDVLRAALQDIERPRRLSSIPAFAAAALLLAALVYLMSPKSPAPAPGPLPAHDVDPVKASHRGWIGTLEGAAPDFRLRAEDGSVHLLSIDPARPPLTVPVGERVFVQALLEGGRAILLQAVPLAPAGQGARAEWDCGSPERGGTRRYGLALMDGQKFLPGVHPVGILPAAGRFNVEMPEVRGPFSILRVAVYAWLDSNENGIADERDRLFCLPGSNK